MCCGKNEDWRLRLVSQLPSLEAPSSTESSEGSGDSESVGESERAVTHCSDYY
jgi:hypothetical protein